MTRSAFDLEMIRVADGLWCLRRPSYVTCSYLVETTRDVTFIDAGMSGSGRDVLEALRHIGHQPHDVEAVLLTHWHNDIPRARISCRSARASQRAPNAAAFAITCARSSPTGVRSCSHGAPRHAGSCSRPHLDGATL